MPAFVDLRARKFGRLSVIGRFDVQNKITRWECLCECGNVRVVRSNALQGGRSKSCGCLNREISQQSNRKHGQTKSNHTAATPEYTTWCGIVQRCTNPKNAHYDRYGGRGITICDKWRDDFTAFYEDMGKRPVGTSIDRIDNNKGYEPGNCRWTDKKTQQNNLSNNIVITHGGITMTLPMWAEKSGLSQSCLAARIRRGWPVERALFEKPQKRAKTVAREPGADSADSVWTKGGWNCDCQGRGD